jgi:sortase (surface protein transpeptidase)
MTRHVTIVAALVLLLVLPSAASAQAPAAPARASAAPARLVIKAIGLDQTITSVGLDNAGRPIVPDHTVGWYNQSAMPGQGENVVFWGHVLRFKSAPKIPAPFANLKKLKPGARITIYDAAGNAHVYVVSKQVWAKPSEVKYILPQGREMVTMVSCIGKAVVVGREVVDMSNRLITIAVPAK